MVSRNNWEAVVVEQREPVQIFQLEGDLRRECPGYVFSSSSAVLVRQSLNFSKTEKRTGFYS